MITDFFLKFLVSLVPQVDMPTAFTSFNYGVLDSLAVVNHYIPISTFLVMMGLYLVLWVTCAVVSVVLQLG